MAHQAFEEFLGIEMNWTLRIDMPNTRQMSSLHFETSASIWYLLRLMMRYCGIDVASQEGFSPRLSAHFRPLLSVGEGRSSDQRGRKRASLW